ncbi:MAG: hypothetical protein JXR70_16045 [Spirochaetales bacterium]|nr:hypothetical protein [Spirochaetales bacterium]
MDKIDHVLNKYVEQILQLNQKQELSQKDLSDIALDLGISEQDLKAINQHIEDHTSQARGYFDNQLYDKAAEAVEEVIKAAPFHYELHILGAESYSKLYELKGGPAFKNRCQELAETAIAINPKPQRPYVLLKKLNHPGYRKKIWPGKTFVLVSGVAALGLAALFWLMPARNEQAPLGFRPQLEFMEELASDKRETEPKPLTNQEPSFYKETGDYEVLVVLPSDRDARGISLDVNAQLSRYIDSFSVRLKGRLGAVDQEIHKCQLKVELAYKNKGIFDTRIIDGKADYEPDIRPGFVNDFEYLSYQENLPLSEVEARISIHLLESFKAPLKYPLLEKIPLEWKVPQSPGYEISARLREHNVSSYFSDISSRITIELENTGTQRLSGLRLACEWYDDKGILLKSNDSYGAASNRPPFLPGEKRAVSFFTNLDKLWAEKYTYKVFVIEIQ